MKPLFASMAAVFVITFLGAPAMGAGWFWDTGNRRLDVRAHQVIAYVVLTLAVAHAFWFLLGDDIAVEFIKIGAPDYMWLGIVGLFLFAVLIMTADLPDRLRLHKSYPSFKYWHRVLTVVVIACAAYHIIASDFYLGTWYQAALFAMVSLAVAFGREYWIRLGQIVIASPLIFVAFSGVLIALFAGLRNLPA
jgi:hypothetical protein